MEVTMNDVAQEAGVGVATVDRVINKRARVNPDTAERVLAAAEKLGFRRTSLIRNRIDERTAGYTLGIILLKKTTPVYQQLGETLSRTAQEHLAPKGKVLITYLDELTPEHIVERLWELQKKVDAIALVSTDHPLITQAIEQINAKGTLVFALMSNLTSNSCRGLIGIDHRKAGRTAAWAMSKLINKPGKIALLVGNHGYQCQEQNEIGFRSYFRESAPEFEILETLVTLEEINLGQVATLELLKKHPDLKGLYMAGGGIEGVLKALDDNHISKDLAIIALDLTNETRQALIDKRINMVIAHPFDWMARSLFDVMIETLESKNTKGSLQITLPFITYTEANV